MQNARILVLDADSNAGLAVVQSLGAAGYHCIVGGASKEGAAFTSRYVAESVLYPDPMTDAAAFKAWITSWVRERDVALVIPVTERTLVPLHEMRGELDVVKRVAMPSKATLDRVLDKEQLRELAARLEIPVPASAIVTSARDLADDRIDEWLREGAAVVKTIKSKVWNGQAAKQFPVIVVRSRDELVRAVVERVEHVPVQVQQWVPGRGLGVELLARDGEILMSIAHERLHELPLTGGGSTYRRTIPMPADLLEDARKLTRALAYDGVAMVEFRGDETTGRRWLVEINARFWGSLPLAVFAGADFPKALVELLVEGKVPSDSASRTDVYARQIDRDLEWLKVTIKRRGRFAREELTKPLGRSLLEWGRVVTGRETWDGASLRDPIPMVNELRRIVGHEIEGVLDRTRRKAVRAAARRTSLRRATRYADARKVLFICYGNICRSPYAQYRLVEAAGGREVRSAGFHRTEHRPTTDAFLRAARGRGIDLSSHRSRMLAEADLEWADLVVIMDQRNYEDLLRFNSAATNKVVWLGALDGAPIEIDDPYDMDEAHTATVLDRIDRCLAVLTGASQ
ncbi:MAG: hypothetical protein HOW73_23845 [Polyangiaceae bacterium]|nr:hypothetical protein [Polyangiaceae bacterium]